jgi:hypothetical protein
LHLFEGASWPAKNLLHADKLVIHEVNNSQNFEEHREKYCYDDTAIDKMVKSVNRIVQSDKMVD